MKFCSRVILGAAIVLLDQAAYAQQYVFLRVLGPPVSSGGPGVQTNTALTQPALSIDGSTLVFRANGSNFTPGVSGPQILAYDIYTGAISVASTTPAGQPSAPGTSNDRPVVSTDGRFVAFETNSSSYIGSVAGVHIVRVDQLTHAFKLVDLNATGALPAATISRLGGISGDGRYVVFTSNASNLVAGDPANNTNSVFVRDLLTDVSRRIDVSSAGVAGNGGAFGELPSISADGRFVAFSSTATNLVGGGPFGGSQRIYLRDLNLNTTTRVGIGPGNIDLSGAGNAAISADGQNIIFRSSAGGGSATQMWSRQLSNPFAVAVPAAPNMGLCDRARMASTGIAIVQCRNSSAAQPRQAFAWSLQSAGLAPELISGSDPANTIPGNGNSGEGLDISGGAEVFAFESVASDLVASDTNGVSDIFLYVQIASADTVFANGFDP